MIIVVVEFMAYNKPMNRGFINKTFEQVHNELNDICNTYVPTAIYQAGEANFVSLDKLTQFKNDNSDKK